MPKQNASPKNSSVKLRSVTCWNLAPSCRVKRPQSKLDRALGKVLLMEWGADGRLMATVEIDPLPPDHPMQRRDPRYRPAELPTLCRNDARRDAVSRAPRSLGVTQPTS